MKKTFKIFDTLSRTIVIIALVFASFVCPVLIPLLSVVCAWQIVELIRSFVNN